MMTDYQSEDRNLALDSVRVTEAAAIASAVVALPLMVQAAKVGIAGVDLSIEEAARVDGAERWRVLATMTWIAFSIAYAGSVPRGRGWPG